MGALRNITKALLIVTGRYRMLQEHYGALMELLQVRNVMEPLRKILILPITN